MSFFFPLLLLWPSEEASPRLAVIRPAADFKLIDQNEKPARLSDYRGKAVLVGFIFTTCSGTCPATTQRMARVFHELEKKPGLKEKVHFLSITLDPERDRPEVLRHYRKLYDIEGPRWGFLTGTPSEIKDVLPRWDMWVRPTEKGQLDHPSRVFLVDPKGRIREIYNLDFMRPGWVVEDIGEVLKEED